MCHTLVVVSFSLNAWQSLMSKALIDEAHQIVRDAGIDPSVALYSYPTVSYFSKSVLGPIWIKHFSPCVDFGNDLGSSIVVNRKMLN